MPLPLELEAIPDWITSQFVRAGVDRKSNLKWPVFVTSSDETGVSGRVVVLRRFDPVNQLASIYTDKRSTKIKAISSNNQVELVFFDPKQMLQIRARGSARFHLDGPKKETILDALSDRSLSDYATVMAPGADLLRCEPERAVERARDNFALIEVAIEELDVLSLVRSGHRRVKMQRNDGTYRASWVVP